MRFNWPFLKDLELTDYHALAFPPEWLGEILELSARQPMGGEAEERAKALLLAYLTPEQRETYRYSGVIEVPDGSSLPHCSIRIETGGPTQYVIVWRMRNGNKRARYCVWPRPVRVGGVERALPFSDQLLALLIWLTADPRSFYRVANLMET